MSVTSVLWVTPHADPLLLSGGALRTARLIRELSKDFPVDVLVVGDPAIDLAQLKAVSGARATRWFPGTKGAAARSLALRHRWPLSVARMWDLDAHDAVQAATDAVVVAEHPQSALYAPCRPYVLQLQNAEGRRVRELPMPRGISERLHRQWERATLPRWEQSAVQADSAHVVLVSPDDARSLGVPASIVPNGTDLQPPRSVPDRGTLLFVGALDYAPNTAGLRWWAEQVWPHLPDGIPALCVVGRGGRAALGTLAEHPSLNVIGEVADLRPHYAAAGLVVVPLLHGSGTRLKVLEAMAWSVPVLSTAKGAEGLDFRAGRDLVIADSPEEFAYRTARLLNSPQARHVGQAGRFAAEPYSWDRLGETMRQLVASLASDQQQRQST